MTPVVITVTNNFKPTLGLQAALEGHEHLVGPDDDDEDDDAAAAGAEDAHVQISGHETQAWIDAHRDL